MWRIFLPWRLQILTQCVIKFTSTSVDRNTSLDRIIWSQTVRVWCSEGVGASRYLLCCSQKKEPETASGIELNHLLLLQPISFFSRNINETSNWRRVGGSRTEERRAAAISTITQTNSSRRVIRSLLQHRAPTQTALYWICVVREMRLQIKNHQSLLTPPVWHITPFQSCAFH